MKKRLPMVENVAGDERDRSKWIPVVKIQCTFVSDLGVEYHDTMRTQIPLRLAFSWTIHKSQGQTIDNPIMIYLGATEKTPNSTYVALSRTTDPDNITILPDERVGTATDVTANRFMKKLVASKLFYPRMWEECRLEQLDIKLRFIMLFVFIKKNDKYNINLGLAEKEKEDLQNEWNLYETNVSLLDFILQTSNLKDFEKKIDNILPKDWPIYEKTPTFFKKYNPLSINQKDKEKRTFLKNFQSTST